MPSLRESIESAVSEAAARTVQTGSYRRYVGPESEQLQVAISKLFGQAHVLLTNSGTVALEIALKSLNVLGGDQIILSGYDYPGNFWVVEQLGCVPTLIDVRANSTKVDLQQLQAARNDRTRAVVVSHLHGESQEMGKIRAWADDSGVILIEDACQAIGAKLQGKPVGSFGHMSLLSFGGSKVISAGRGGALVTSDERLFQKAKIASGAGSGAYALSELSAAIVNAQLSWLSQINQAVSAYFAEVEVLLPVTLRRSFLGTVDAMCSAFYQAGWLMEDSTVAQRIIQRLSEKQLPVGSGFAGFHRRSARRCNLTFPLTNTASLVDRLVTIHHSIALDQVVSASQLAIEFAAAAS